MYANKQRIQMVSVNRISVVSQHTRTNTDVVDLAESIRAVGGLINPLIINSKYQLISGGRRMEAAQALGMEEVPCLIIEKDSLIEELVSIDENLIRLQLGSAAFDFCLSRKAAIYKERFPHTTRPGKAPEGEKEVPSFAEDTAKKLSVSRRSIEKAIARVERASSDLKKARGRDEFSPSQIDQLVTLTPIDQNKLIPHLKGLDTYAVKSLVSAAKEFGIDSAIRETTSFKYRSHFRDVEKCCLKLTDLLDTLIAQKEEMSTNEKKRLKRFNTTIGQRLKTLTRQKMISADGVVKDSLQPVV